MGWERVTFAPLMPFVSRLEMIYNLATGLNRNGIQLEKMKELLLILILVTGSSTIASGPDSFPSMPSLSTW